MAIEINGIKHACASCIRGHRVKKCNHVEREMVPIPKRGRQISQCNHCRSLRKSNRTHVKCTCAIANAPNPINGCLCEIVHSCSCVAHHLQDTSKTSENNNTLAITPPDTTSTTSSSSSPVSLNDFFDMTSPSVSAFSSVPSEVIVAPTSLSPQPPILSTSPSLSSSSAASFSSNNNQYGNSNNYYYNNSMTTMATDNDNANNMMTTMMIFPQETPLMSLSISELLDLPLQFTINNDVDLTSTLQMQNSF